MPQLSTLQEITREKLSLDQLTEYRAAVYVGAQLNREVASALLQVLKSPCKNRFSIFTADSLPLPDGVGEELCKLLVLDHNDLTTPNPYTYPQMSDYELLIDANSVLRNILGLGLSSGRLLTTEMLIVACHKGGFERCATALLYAAQMKNFIPVLGLLQNQKDDRFYSLELYQVEFTQSKT